MNLLGRFLILVVQALLRQPSGDPLAIVYRHYRVWPHDMDLNFHLTAARYFSFGDLCRIQWLIDSGMGRAFLKGRYRAVLNAQEMTYIREFPPLTRVDIEVQLMCWDQKYAYFEQRFYHNRRLHSIGHARMAILRAGKVISTGDALAELGHSLQSPPETEAIRDWKETLAAKRDRFS